MLGDHSRGVLVALVTVITQPSCVNFLPVPRGATGMVNVMVCRLMLWSVDFEDEACWCCAPDMMAAIAVGRAGKPFSL